MFSDWLSLSPEQAAREVHARVRMRLSAAQQRAVIAQLPDEARLAHAFASAARTGPLGGVPYFVKDLFPVAGQPMRAGSTFLPAVKRTPATDSRLVRTLRAAGAVLAGQAHLHEFAYGITGENPHYGDCEHPYFPGRTTGGSSSGSAALVAAGIVPLALGSDTGGSVRLPAAFCGLFGFRLTPRDPFIADAFPLAPSYDTAGWFTANARDMRTVVDALVKPLADDRSPRGGYLGFPDLDADVARACRAAASRITAPLSAAAAAELHLAFCESSATYNTVVADEAWRVHRPWAEKFRDRYDPAVWARIMRVQALDARQRKAARRHTLAIKAAWARYFRDHDFLVLPVAPFGALTKAACTVENRARILALTSPASIGGLPVLTVPVPLPSGLTAGLQVVVPEPRSAAIGWVLERLAS